MYHMLSIMNTCFHSKKIPSLCQLIIFITSIGYNKRRDYFGMLCIILTTVDEKTILLGSELGTKFGCSGAPEFEVTCIVLHNNE